MRKILRLIIFSLFLSLPFSSFAIIDENPVLIISSYNPETPTTSRTIQSFMSEYEKLGLHYPVAIENMNCKSFSESYRWKRRFETLIAKHKCDSLGKSPVALVLLGQEAWASYLASDIVKERIPVVSGMISETYVELPSDSASVSGWLPLSRNLKENNYLREQFAGIVFSYNLPRNISLIKSIYPETKNIAFLTDNTYGGVNLQSYVRDEMNDYPELNLIELDGRENNIYTIQSKLSALPDNSVLLLGAWRIDMNDSYFMNSATYTMMNANLKLPAFSLTGLGMNHWAIGGVLPDYHLQGPELAQKLYKLLSNSGFRKQNKISYLSNKYTFDVQRLNEFGIAFSALPKERVMLNHENDFWKEHPALLRLIFIILILLVIVLVIASFFILKLKRLNHALLKSESDNRLILNNIGVGLVYVNTNLEVEWESTAIFNEAASVWQFKVGHKCYEGWPGCTRVCNNCPLSEVMSTRTKKDRIYHFGDTYYNIVYNPINDEQGKPKGFLLRIEDVTQKELAKAELEKAKEAAEEADRLKSNFLANMSHEIRTPLNAIVGFSEIIANTDNQKEKKNYMKIVANNNDILLQLINDILDLSKIDAGTLEFHEELIDINLLLQELFFLFEKRVKAKDLDFQIRNQLEVCRILTDKHRLSQVITNFLTNSIKFTNEGSVLMGYRIRGDEFQIYVTDSGCGIPTENRREVFGRFVKLNSFAQGTGLGLSICEVIARNLGAHVDVESEEGKGSTFWISFPLSVIHEIKERSTPGEPYPLKRHTILIAEDEADNYRLLEMILQREYNLVHAWNGREAIEKFSEHRPDLVLMDIQMPEIDGYEATLRIREKCAEIPVIAVTAYAFREEEIRARHGGFTDFVTKPINKTTIKEKIKTLLN